MYVKVTENGKYFKIPLKKNPIFQYQLIKLSVFACIAVIQFCEKLISFMDFEYVISFLCHRDFKKKDRLGYQEMEKTPQGRIPGK